jgi:hypothetical protein
MANSTSGSKKKKKPIWERKNPKKQHEKMTAGEQAAAKRSAQRHGRKQPSLVENINAQKH